MQTRRHFLTGIIAALTTICVGCASIGAPLSPSLELIKPPTDLHAVRKGDRVYLTWTIATQTMEHQTVRHRGPTLVCRSLHAIMAECGSPAGSIAADQPSQAPVPKGQRPQATFVDQIPPDLFTQNTNVESASNDSIPTVTYAVEALNTSSRAAGLSNQVQVLLVPTAPPPKDFRAELMPTGVRLSWTGELLSIPVSRVFDVYRVYRRLEGSTERTLVGEVPRGFEAQPSLLDQTFAWEKHYEYWINVVTEVQTANQPCAAKGNSNSCTSNVEIEGDDSPAVAVFTHDIFPPAVPTGLQAVFSGAGQQPFIDLVWAPDTDADLGGYNVFRHEPGSQPIKINSELVKTPSYRDTNVVSGKTYYYSVSAVDLRGNESAQSGEASEQVP